MRRPAMVRRWLTGRGFGVHSPLAFRLIRYVLRSPGSWYYAFDEPGAPRTRAGRRHYRMQVAAAEMGARWLEWPTGEVDWQAPCVLHAMAPLDALPSRGIRFTDGRESYIVDLPGLSRADYELRFL